MPVGAQNFKLAVLLAPPVLRPLLRACALIVLALLPFPVHTDGGPMSSVAHILTAKGTKVLTVSPDASVLEAAQVMNTHRIGSLAVVDDAQNLVGMFTERDILTRVVAAERSPSGTRVREVMTERLLTCTPQTNLDQLRHTMRSERIRHIPVIDEGRLAGMVSLGDLNTAEVKVLCQTIEYLEQYSVRV